MTATLPTASPSTAVAGDTWTWTDESDDHSAADGWAVAYRIAGPDALTWDASWVSAVGTLSTIAIPADMTAPLRAGGYRVAKTYTKGAERFTVECSPLTVSANPDTLAAGDTVSWATKTLAAIESFLAGHLEDGVSYYQIGNRQITTIPLPELITMRNDLRNEVKKERRSRPGFGRVIRYRFQDTR